MSSKGELNCALLCYGEFGKMCDFAENQGVYQIINQAYVGKPKNLRKTAMDCMAKCVIGNPNLLDSQIIRRNGA